ncbi:MAG TPA: protein kinase [Steroidobacteraceae bacterium]|nr:protein kinase [Steroidobacteraceae bacterium]
MIARTESTSSIQPRSGTEGAALVWLDALAGGLCTPEAFLNAVHEQAQADPEESWEVLSLLDQYYRRGKIKAELFHSLKSRLEGSAFDANQEAAPAARPHAPTPVPPPPDAWTHAPTPVPPPPSTTATTETLTVVPTVTATSVTAPAAKTPGKPSTASRPALKEIRREVAIGDVLRGRYRIRGVFGHGGMGTVFDATDEYRVDLPGSGKRIAIKVLHTAVTQRDELLAELQSEFQHLQLLSHPNIVRVHEFDRDGDNTFFTMEPLIGALLSQVIGARNAVALPRPYALAVMRDIGAALAHAHSRGIVHGDVNPQNIFITNDGELRVLDFGASHKLLRDAGRSQRAPVATPGYASCQLLEGQHPDARDDLFAFACVAYLLLSGQHPFPRLTAIEARVQRVRPSRPPGLTGRQWQVLREGLRWERDRRPRDVQKWLDRFGLAAAAPHLPPLNALMNAPAPRKTGVVRAAAAIAVLAALAAGGYWSITHYDSLMRLVKPAAPVATQQESPAPDSESAPAPRAVPTPAPRDAATTAAARSVAAPSAAAPSAAAPSATAPSAAAPAGAAPMATGSTASAPAVAAPTATAPTATAPRSTTAGPGAATAPARPSTGGTSVHAGNAGPIRVEMVSDTVDVEPSDQAARITVRRRGNVHGDASFTWWTESGTAKPGRDFYPAIPSVEHIPDGRDSVTLNVPILSTPRGNSKSFYVVIDRAESGVATLGARNLTMVTIQPRN